MHKYASIALIGLALTGLSAGALASTTDSSNGAGSYVGLQAGQSEWSVNGHHQSNKFGWEADGGYRWALTPRQSAGVELGYVDFGHSRSNTPFSTSTYSSHAVTLGGSYRYAFKNSPVFLEGRAGYARWDGHASETIYNTSYDRASDRGNGWYGGVGLGYALASNIDLKLQSDFYRQNNAFGNNHMNNVVTTFGAEYRF